jgi:hypothetical protein
MAEVIYVYQTPLSHRGREWTVDAWDDRREDGAIYLEGAFGRAVARAA